MFIITAAPPKRAAAPTAPVILGAAAPPLLLLLLLLELATGALLVATLEDGTGIPLVKGVPETELAAEKSVPPEVAVGFGVAVVFAGLRTSSMT